MANDGLDLFGVVMPSHGVVRGKVSTTAAVPSPSTPTPGARPSGKPAAPAKKTARVPPQTLRAIQNMGTKLRAASQKTATTAKKLGHKNAKAAAKLKAISGRALQHSKRLHNKVSKLKTMVGQGMSVAQTFVAPTPDQMAEIFFWSQNYQQAMAMFANDADVATLAGDILAKVQPVLDQVKARSDGQALATSGQAIIDRANAVLNAIKVPPPPDDGSGQ